MKPKNRTSSTKKTQRKGNRSDVMKPLSPAEKAKRKAAAQKREEEYWASKSGPVKISYLPGFEPKEQ